MIMQNQNPIEKRLDRITDHWKAFIENPEARLLRWCVDREEMRMIDIFVAIEQDDRRSFDTTTCMVCGGALFAGTHEDPVMERDHVAEGPGGPDRGPRP